MGYGLRHGVYDFKREIVSAGAAWPTDSIVARWDFNDNLTDTINSYALTSSSGTPSWTYGTGLINKSYLCNSTASSAATRIWSSYNNSTSAVYNVTGSTAWSISLWLKITNASADIMQPINFYSGSTFRFCLNFHGASYTPPGSIRGAVCAQGAAQYTPYNVDMRDNAWHHYVLTYGSTTIKLYVDGTERGSDSMSQVSSSDIIRIGGSGNSTSDSWILNGHMDLLYLYSKTLTTTEISTLYNGGTGV
jgi:hypothetical protein